MWKSANLLLKSSRLVAEMTLLGSRFHRGIRDGKNLFYSNLFSHILFGLSDHGLWWMRLMNELLRNANESMHYPVTHYYTSLQPSLLQCLALKGL